MKKIIFVTLLALIALVGSCAKEEDEAVLKFAVNSPSPITITCASDQLGQAIFTSPGGPWAFDLPFELPVTYEMEVESTVAQTIEVSIIVQEDYRNVFIVVPVTSVNVNIGTPYIKQGILPQDAFGYDF